VKSAASFTSVDDYIAAQPSAVQGMLELVRSTICKAVPNVEEAISFSIPTYRLYGRPMLYFAGWRTHYALYPTTNGLIATFGRDLEPYDVKGGAITFRFSEPVPVDVIDRIARYRAQEVAYGGPQ
jgi:uncharacterized protein YdhG (YjbR/CyaY superfamily)